VSVQTVTYSKFTSESALISTQSVLSTYVSLATGTGIDEKLRVWVWLIHCSYFGGTVRCGKPAQHDAGLWPGLCNLEHKKVKFEIDSYVAMHM
jgi:hypothetical protein